MSYDSRPNMETIIHSDLNADAPEFKLETRKGQPHRFAPPHYEYHERREVEQPLQTNVRNAQRLLEDQDPILAQNTPALVRDLDIDAPTATYRERNDSMYSNDSLLHLTGEELAQRQREIFGENQWQQEQNNFQQPPRAPSPYEQNFPLLEPTMEPVLPTSDFTPNHVDSQIPSFMPLESPVPVMSAKCPVPATIRRPIGQFIRELALWHNVKDSAVIFSMGTFLLFALSYFSFISVMAYTALTFLLLASGLVFARQLQYALQQRQGPHPFERLIQQEVVFSPEYAHQQLDSFLMPLNRGLVRMRNLFLADSLGQTLKLALLVYLMTYVGAWFNLLTLAMMVWVSAFTIPRMYVMFRPQFDGFFRMVRENMSILRIRIMRIIRWNKAKLETSSSTVPTAKVQKKITIEKREKVQ